MKILDRVILLFLILIISLLELKYQLHSHDLIENMINNDNPSNAIPTTLSETNLAVPISNNTSDTIITQTTTGGISEVIYYNIIVLYLVYTIIDFVTSI